MDTVYKERDCIVRKRRKETKAERIFRETRTSCMLDVRKYGCERNLDGTAIGYYSVVKKDSDTIYMRTINSLTKILNSHRNKLQSDLERGRCSPEEFQLETEILDKVEVTINNNRENILAFKKMLDNVENELENMR